MTEGRRCQVHLLDDRKLELLVQPKLLAKELLDLVASHFNLKEKEYFGIAFTDETGHLNWLQLDRRVLEHDFPKKSGPVVLYFCVRFYIESISYLKDNATIELFFLNAKSCIYKELIDVDSEVVFELASYILQEAKGDFSSNEVVRSDLKKLPALPTQALKEHPSLAYCEDRVIEYYKKLNGQTRGQAIVNYMSIVESLPTYGVHYYAVKDKQGIPWWLGLSYKGIFQYDYHDKVKPRKIFQWRQLENLYFREKKFSVEVHDPRRASVTRRTFGHSGIAVHTWYACPALIKSIWAMAISQHQFYLDRKQSKSKIHAARSLSEIAIDLTETGTLKTSKLANMGSKGKIISGSSGSLLSSGSQESDSSQSAKKDMLAALKSRQEALEETLRQRLEELKRLCLREAELTGKLPVEYPLDPGEEPPIVRRRIGTAFKLDEQKILPKGEEAELERLEREFAIQSQITEAARRLASDPNVSKKLKKQRKTSYLNALKKLQEIENAINENRIKSGKKPTQRASLVIDDGNIASEDSSLSDALVLEDEDSQVTSTISPLQSPHKGLPPRPPSSHNRPPPPQSLEGLRQLHYHRTDYDKSPLKPKMWSESSLDEPYEKVKKRSSHGHSSSHKRFPSTGSCTEAGVSSSLQNSPIRSLPHWNSQSSMPSTPDLRVRSPHYVHSTRSVDISPTRLHSLALHFRHRSSSLESQGKLLGSENDTGSPDFYTPRTRSSNGSDPMDDCSSCTSHSSSEHYYPAQMNANYSTLAEDSPSKARQRQRQRQRAAGALGSASSGSMPNLAARSGAASTGGGVYLHSQSQPSSQYRIKEYPLYIEGSATPVVVRSLESDQEGHYSVKAQFKTSNSYTAGGLFKESWRGGGDEGDAGRLTPSRSQILRTPSLGRDGAHDKGSGRAAVSDELRQWYQRSTASHKEHSRLSHTSSTSSDSGSQYSTSSQSTFVAHSRVTRMPQMCKATSAALPQSQRSSTPSSEIGATPPSSPHHILTWQTGEATENSPIMDGSESPTHQSTDE
ncbi:FERM domain-containing protein 4A isoform X7 [Mus musculus]|uniref:FERM domain-containing protein 4A n=3 Tax=Mus TaxID=862507 RepID=FRM4A_MOUSE|nr:FERM domain-containing protein 4A isoform 2 [Mus musculus]XP_021042111.1 FERM domain-containing protein 4A isoform X4 [Mus caroli]XP_030105029.1 FERM domain-containing protein 4A isoform X7 [Mus musculus]Q8BIE6.2 RecName: Full=FERM domain-containing protein 4A [Mus musculus]|eukprot:NP_001171314.1 FERM domain-containing protein 4A isoform 2 [Mus musculus]